MNGRRVGALILAVALVVGAFVLRRNVIEDDDKPTTDGTEVDQPEGDEATALYCITELAAACENLGAANDKLEITIEDAGVTLDRLAALEGGDVAPLWLTIDPYPAMVDVLRGPNGSLGFETMAVGSSQLAIAFPADGRADAMVNTCAGDPVALWRCIGDNTGMPWTTIDGASFQGTVRPSFGHVQESALALTSFGHAVAGYFGETDPDNTQFGDVGFITWLRRVTAVSVRGTQVDNTPLGTMAARQSALDVPATAMFEVNALERTYDESLAGATESPETSTAATAPESPEDRFDVKYSDPEMWIQAVIATPAGVSVPSDLDSDLANALADAGWDPASAADGTLPSASTLLALRQLWIDYT